MTCTHSYGLASLPAASASSADLLALLRGHWQVESANHYRRDKTFGEDSNRVRTAHGPASSAALNNLALALILPQQRGTVPEAQIHFAANREKVLQLPLAPV